MKQLIDSRFDVLLLQIVGVWACMHVLQNANVGARFFRVADVPHRRELYWYCGI